MHFANPAISCGRHNGCKPTYFSGQHLYTRAITESASGGVDALHV